MKPQYEVKNALTDRINGRLATAEEKTDEFKDIAVETTQNVLQKKKKNQNSLKKASVICRTTLSSLIYM